MKWTYLGSNKETDHKFLNFYTLHYEVLKDDGTMKNTDYFVASRNLEKNELRIVKQDFDRADAVLIGAYTLKDGKPYLLLERQFRQALNHEVISFPAGLVDKEDKDITSAARRELREETGYEADEIELLLPPSPTSEGLSDECNAVVLARLANKGEDEKEEFEDIQARLYSLEELRKLLNDKTNIFSNSARLLILYLMERFR
jgi:ADP-ribose pyrophosphatase